MHPETYYHIYNHANGDENLFRSDENYYYFLRQWAKYIEPVAETYAYCLMPNHIHFLIRTETSKVFENLGGLKSKPPDQIISQAFSNLFNSYTKSFNKMYDRKGSLFIPNFKRKAITHDAYLTTLIAYIHRNPIHHGFCSHLEDWSHSSYHAYLSTQKTKIKRKFILDWFYGKRKFIQYHREQSFLPDQSLFIDF